MEPTIALDFGRQQEVLSYILQGYGTPANYLVIDTETSGFSPTADVLVDLGWLYAQNDVVVNNGNWLLDWSKVPGVSHAFIQEQLKRQSAAYAQIGRPHYYSWERLCAEGRDPREAIPQYVKMIYDAITSDTKIVGHGLWFDQRVINGHTNEYMNYYELPWQNAHVFDTGLLEKAIQVGILPEASEPLADFSRRVDDTPIKGIKWNMESHCVPKYQLRERFGMNMQFMHTAGFDCALIHHLLQTFKQLAGVR